MTSAQVWMILTKRWKLVLICFIFVGVGAFIGSKLMKQQYQSSTLVEVIFPSSASGQSSNYDNLMASEQLVQTEATLATSDPVLREVASHYPGLTSGQLAAEVSASPKTSTQLFEIDVVDASPTRAAQLANDVATTLIKQQQQQIQKSNVQAQQQLQQSINSAKQQINSLTLQISNLQAKGGNQGQITLLQAQLNGVQTRYNQWQTALAQLVLAQPQSANPLQIVQPAQPAMKPVKPDVLLNTGEGLVVGFLLGILLAVVYEQLDTRVRTAEEISRLLGWSVLTTLWRAASRKQERVINPANRDPNAEALCILRTNLGFSSPDKPLRSLIVTSAQHQDGKSVVAANLAIFMAKAGKRTLLIDADLRRPTQHTLFGLSAGKPGLSNALLTLNAMDMSRTSSPFFSAASSLQSSASGPLVKLSLESFVHTVGIPNLWVMPAGALPPNPPELLESTMLQNLLAKVEHVGIEIVIFDTPPLPGLSDASILASKVDGAIVVVDVSKATRDTLLQMRTILTQTGVRVLGCVLNKQRYSKSDSAGSYYYVSRANEQNSENKYAGNGHVSNSPDIPVLVTSSFEQGDRTH